MNDYDDEFNSNMEDDHDGMVPKEYCLECGEKIDLENDHNIYLCQICGHTACGKCHDECGDICNPYCPGHRDHD